MKDQINGELRRAALLAQIPGQSARIGKALFRAQQVEQYAAANS